MTRRSATVWLTGKDPLRLAATLAGLDGARRVMSPEDLPADPFDLSEACWLLVGVVSTVDDTAAFVLAAARGVDMVLECRLVERDRAGFLDELGRVATIRADDEQSIAGVLSREHVALLTMLAEGQSVASAGRLLGWSRRTAYRRLDEAGEILSAVSTVDAVRRATSLGLISTER